VRFQTSETVPLQDPEIVLQALETCLRGVSGDVVRSGLEITLRGLGPSPRAVNRLDTTILRVQSEHDRTIINADVSFQASAFLGDISQEDVVRSKLDLIFDQMKLQLPYQPRSSYPTPHPEPATTTQENLTPSSDPSIEAAPASPSEPPALIISSILEPSAETLPLPQEDLTPIPEPAELNPPTSDHALTYEPEYAFELDHEPALTYDPEPLPEPEYAFELDHEPTSEPIPELKPKPEPISDLAPQPSPALAIEPEPDPEPAPVINPALNPSPEPELKLIPKQASTSAPPSLPQPVALAAEQLHRSIGSHPEDSPPIRYSYGPPIALAASLLILVPSLYLLHQHSASQTPPHTHPISSTAAPAAPAPTAVPLTTPVATPPPVVTPPPAADPADASTPPIATTHPTDPKAWLDDWVAVMRTRDPVAQVAFYANPVDRYLDKRNVTNAELIADKRAAIHNREGLWTVKLENIHIDPQTGSTVTVHLTKHYMAETEPAQISEQLIPARLQLTRINNQWKITSEQDLP
jgi:hypothetical protein